MLYYIMIKILIKLIISKKRAILLTKYILLCDSIYYTYTIHHLLYLLNTYYEIYFLFATIEAQLEKCKSFNILNH